MIQQKQGKKLKIHSIYSLHKKACKCISMEAMGSSKVDESKIGLMASFTKCWAQKPQGHKTTATYL